MTQRGPRALWLVVVVAVAGTSTSGTVVSAFGPPSQGPGQAAATDYCAMLGGDNIQGKKSGFLAGNKVLPFPPFPPGSAPHTLASHASIVRSIRPSAIRSHLWDGEARAVLTGQVGRW